MSELEVEFQLLRSATFEWTHALSARLEEEGVPHRVTPVGERRATDVQWAVYVPFTELELAREIDREVMLELFPDLPQDFDPAALDTSRCPACQEPVVEGAAICASCGLAFVDGE
ncbi:MAG TPA: zinc ribbon domain-containing protein [Myxococcota bacterium]|nr:zinc ribbon domain-containing protein [Myxococcota bacterium]